MEGLLDFLNSIRPLSPALRNTLIDMLKTKAVAAGDYILKEGSICNKICFIETGLFGCFSLVDNRERVSWFMKQGDVFISVRSFFDQSISWESIIALEDSTVHYVTYDEYVYLKNKFPEFDSIRGDLLEYYYKLADLRLYITLGLPTKTRCSFFFEHFGELAQLVPGKYLAAYLGMEETTFSRAKKEFFRESSKAVFK